MRARCRTAMVSHAAHAASHASLTWRSVEMSQDYRRTQTSGYGWAVGWASFAAFMMIVLGCWWLMAGFIAILNDEFYVAGAEYIFQFDTTTWGWIHLTLGVLVALAGVALFSGAVWARTVGVVLAVLCGVAAFAWLPWYPIWALVLIAVSAAVIWALTAHGRDISGEY
jgi:hypothetical protein